MEEGWQINSGLREMRNNNGSSPQEGEKQEASAACLSLVQPTSLSLSSFSCNTHVSSHNHVFTMGIKKKVTLGIIFLVSMSHGLQSAVWHSVCFQCFLHTFSTRHDCISVPCTRCRLTYISINTCLCRDNEAFGRLTSAAVKSRWSRNREREREGETTETSMAFIPLQSTNS